MNGQFILKSNSSQGDAPRLFQEFLNKLGAESSQENLFKELVHLLHRDLHLEDCFFLGLRVDQARLCVKQGSLVSAQTINPYILDEISKVLQAFPEKQVDGDVNHLLQVQGAQYQFRFFTNGYQVEGVLFWLESSHSLTSYLLEQVLGVTEQFCRWCYRYSNSQDLMYRDDLTSLYNYRYLEICLENEIRRVQRFQGAFSLLFIDLDSFKPINDSYGHLVGSSVLKQTSQLLKLVLRDVDSIFRYGGDEFVVLLLEAEPEKASRVAERLRSSIAAHEFTVGSQGKVKLTASIGVACCPQHSTDKEQLLRMADECMYKSKRCGKNKVAMVSRTDA